MTPTVSQAVLVAIGAGARSYDDVVHRTGLQKKQINAAMCTLRRRALIVGDASGHVLTDAGRGWLGAGKVVASGQGKRSRKPAGLRERAWWLMRETRQITLSDLLTTLATGEERDAESNLRRYLNALETVGVLRKLKRRHGGVEVIWRIARDVGRLAPILRKNGDVFDPNARAVLSLEVPHEQLA